MDSAQSLGLFIFFLLCQLYSVMVSTFLPIFTAAVMSLGQFVCRAKALFVLRLSACFDSYIFLVSNIFSMFCGKISLCRLEIVAEGAIQKYCIDFAKRHIHFCLIIHHIKILLACIFIEKWNDHITPDHPKQTGNNYETRTMIVPFKCCCWKPWMKITNR